MEYKPVNTPVGHLEGRDAIFLDRVEQNYRDRTIVFFGEVNAGLASGYCGKAKWLSYELSFEGIDALQMIELDCFEEPQECASSFVTLSPPNLKSRVKSCQQFILMTYDHVFEMMATGYEFKITGERS